MVMDTAELACLAAGLQALKLEVSEAELCRLLAYRDLLLKWNKIYNLTALRDPRQAISHHLLDSLAIGPAIAAQLAAGHGTLLDVGSGGGLPGIPLAIVFPQLQVTSVDAVQKKTTFQQQAVIELGLSNVQVRHARVEQLSGSYAMIVSRAFAEVRDFVHLTRQLLAPDGCWLAMKGVRPEAELAALPADVVCVDVLPLVVPGLDAERHLLTLKAGL